MFVFATHDRAYEQGERVSSVHWLCGVTLTRSVIERPRRQSYSTDADDAQVCAWLQVREYHDPSFGHHMDNEESEAPWLGTT